MLTPSETRAREAAISRRALLLGTGAVAFAAALPAAPVLAEASATPIVVRGPLTLPMLKELSEQAMPILQRHFPTCLPEQAFLADPGENYHGVVICCDCPPDDRAALTRCECQWHPLAGTPMVGGMSGYYEPEWDEETAYEALQRTLEWAEKPETMSDAEWAEALAIVGMTPESQAASQAIWERLCSGLDEDEPLPASLESQKEGAADSASSNPHAKEA